VIEALNRDELLRLLGAAKKRRERDWLMFLVAFWHGLRETEVVGGWLTKQHNGRRQRVWYPGLTKASFSDGYITVQRLKGSRKTTQPLMPHSDPLLDERTALPAFLATLPANPETRLFPMSRMQFWRLIQLHAAAAKLPPHKAHPHVLKHSIAMSMLEDQIDLGTIQAYLGHESGASTMEYLKKSDEQAAAALARAEQHRIDSPADQLDKAERLSGAEYLRRVLRMIEKSEARGSRRDRGRQ
jgi:integrase